MTISSVVVLVFAIVGAVQTILTTLGAALPATSTVGVWCRKLAVDVKWILGLEKTIEAVVPAVGAADGVASVVSAVETAVQK